MKKIFYILSLALVLFSACSKDDDNDNGGNNGNDTPGGYELKNKPSWVMQSGSSQSMEKPDWTPVEDETPFSSMTAAISFEDEKIYENITSDDVLAVFCEGECIGVTNPVEVNGYGWRFYIYIQQPADKSKGIDLRYYSARTKQQYCWLSCFSFVNDNIIGDLRRPYCPSMEKENGGCTSFATANVCMPEGFHIDWQGGDELAVFVGDECRKVVTDRYMLNEEGFFLFYIPLASNDECFSVRYYSAKQDKTYTSPSYSYDQASGMIIARVLSFAE
ncbi:MAG: hypothetical protein KBT29_00125 [Prevotellaceae bacterium]|nr:hypothetical protein [Candidatus Minthosoma caballi]